MLKLSERILRDSIELLESNSVLEFKLVRVADSVVLEGVVFQGTLEKIPRLYIRVH